MSTKEKVSTAERLQELARINNESQTDMRNRLGFAKSTMSGYWNGLRFPKQNVLTHIAEVYLVSESWLMGYDVPMRKKTIAEATNEELDLLDAWRKLGESQKNVIMATIKAFINEEV